MEQHPALPDRVFDYASADANKAASRSQPTHATRRGRQIGTASLTSGIGTVEISTILARVLSVRALPDALEVTESVGRAVGEAPPPVAVGGASRFAPTCSRVNA
jgi:hypothetical protein